MSQGKFDHQEYSSGPTEHIGLVGVGTCALLLFLDALTLFESGEAKIVSEMSLAGGLGGPGI